MGKEIKQLAPNTVWKHFFELTQIPRPSKFESKAIAYVETFAKSKGLKYTIDKVGNIIVYKNATPGREEARGVILQSHLDMVPQKNSDKKHDFKTDPIETIIDGDWLKANNTTLGADNGIGCAAMLAVLEAENIEHGPIEALFTINEEAGMEGAFGLAPGLLNGSILLNLDSEDEGELFVGCAGGVNVEAITQYTEQEPEEGASFCIAISGLSGGHSGLDIHLGRANANKILGRFLWGAIKAYPSIQIASVQGGDLRNAIPREGHAIVQIAKDEAVGFNGYFNQFKETILREHASSDPGITLELTQADAPQSVMIKKDTERVAALLASAPNGVVRMSVEMEGIVESSLNLAIANFKAGKGELFYLVRSSVESAKNAIVEQIAATHEPLGCRIKNSGNYPGWKPNKESYTLQVMLGVYEELYGKTPRMLAIHAGLECGIIGGTYNGLDMISFGPTIRFPHSPDEKVHIESVEKFWNYLSKTLEKL